MIDGDRIPITPREAYSGDYWRQRAKLTREKASKFASEMMRNSSQEWQRTTRGSQNAQTMFSGNIDERN